MLKLSVTEPVFDVSVSVEPCAEPVIVPPDFIKAPAEATLAVSVTSALASIPSSLLWSASVKAFVSEFASYAVFISALLWSAVALVSIPSNLLLSASVKLFCVSPPSPTTNLQTKQKIVPKVTPIKKKTPKVAKQATSNNT